MPTLSRIRSPGTSRSVSATLAWVIRRHNVVAIPGASSVDQLVRNAEAADLDLSDSEDAELTDTSDAFKPLTGVAAAPAWVRSRLSEATQRE